MTLSVSNGLRVAAALAWFWCGCSTDETAVPINPDPVASGASSSADGTSANGTSTTAGVGGATSASSTATSGAGGNGAGGSEMGPAGYTSGSRLKAHYFVGADGSRQFRAWYDSQLDILCDWARATDGKTRCLPLVRLDTETYTYWESSDCTGKNVVKAPYFLGDLIGSNLTGPDFNTTAYFREAYPADVYALGNAMNYAARALNNNDCILTSGSGYELPDMPVPPDTFVEASFELDP